MFTMQESTYNMSSTDMSSNHQSSIHKVKRRMSPHRLGEAAVRRGEMKRRRQSGDNTAQLEGSEDRGYGDPRLEGGLLRSSSLADKLSSLLPASSRSSSDSGIYSRRSSNATSRRSSMDSLEDSEFEEEPLVNVFPGGNVEDYYDIKEKLGEGAFSTVYLAESKKEKGGLVAVKLINKEELCREDDKMFLVDKEIEIMSQLDHPNIPRLYEVHENQKEVCLVMELAKGGELFDHLLEVGSLSESKSARIFNQLLSAVKELHYQGIVHRDIKPENLLFYDNKTDSRLLLADFGLSDYQEELTSESPLSGTPTYLAPEVIGGSDTPTTAQDLWSCGVILFVMLCGYPPFFCPKDTENGLLRSIVRGRFSFHPAFWDSVSDEAKDLVTRLLCLDPTKRLTSDQVLHHPWIVKHQIISHNDFPILPIAGILLVSGLLISLYFLLLSDFSDFLITERNMEISYNQLNVSWHLLASKFLPTIF